MNYIMIVINPESQDLVVMICSHLHLPVTDVIYGEGTADDSIHSLLGMNYPREKRIITTIADDENTEKLKKALKQYLDIDAPGHGAAVIIPVRSIGGGSTMEYLAQNKVVKKSKPVFDGGHELILCICSRGYTDMVMAAARKAGAKGGTVMHALGTGDKNTPKFYNVTISSEKEVIMMITASSRRNEIMQTVLKEAGPSSPAGSIVLSLPVASVAGIDLSDDN